MNAFLSNDSAEAILSWHGTSPGNTRQATLAIDARPAEAQENVPAENRAFLMCDFHDVRFDGSLTQALILACRLQGGRQYTVRRVDVQNHQFEVVMRCRQSRHVQRRGKHRKTHTRMCQARPDHSQAPSSIRNYVATNGVAKKKRRRRKDAVFRHGLTKGQ